MGNPAFSTHQVIDPWHRGLTVFNFSHPSAWRADSRVEWNFQNTTQPLSVRARAWNPNGLEAVEILPIEQCFWLQPNYMFQPGQSHLGAVCLPPTPPDEMLARWVIPKHRSHFPGLRIQFIRPAPDFPARIRFQQPGARVDGVVARFSYQLNGQPVEEELYAVQVLLPPNGMQVNWGVPRIVSFTAPQGRLADVRPIFWRFLLTLVPNPVFEQVRDQIYQALNQQHMQHIDAWRQKLQSENEMSRMISAQNQQWLDDQARRRETDWQTHQQNMQQWNDQRGAFSQTDAFGDMMMGRETYHDPQNPQGFSQHFGYPEHVWTDGERYHYTDDPNLDPNIGSDRNWTRLHKVATGERYGNA